MSRPRSLAYPKQERLQLVQVINPELLPQTSPTIQERSRTLWNEQIDQVKVNSNVKIENGYVTSFRGETQLNVGRYGKLTVQ